MNGRLGKVVNYPVKATPPSQNAQNQFGGQGTVTLQQWATFFKVLCELMI
jgi:hypothetical protein